MPQKVACKLLAYGMGAEEVTEMIRGRFRLPRWRAEEIVRLLVRGHWRREQWRAKYEASHGSDPYDLLEQDTPIS